MAEKKKDIKKMGYRNPSGAVCKRPCTGCRPAVELELQLDTPVFLPPFIGGIGNCRLTLTKPLGC
jgi:hypothetical protein